MIEFVLKENIERRIKKELLADSYFIDSVLIRVNEDIKHIQLDNSIYFLINEKLDIPLTAKIIISSPDAFFSTSQTDYNILKAHKNQSFRNKIKIETKNYGNEFVPYSLEFLKIVPIQNKKHDKNRFKFLNQ